MRQWGLFDFIDTKETYSLIKPIALLFSEKILPMPPRTLETVIIESKPQDYEDLNVHAIYDEIAPHFASTRYKVR